jgi:hypothetical protein
MHCVNCGTQNLETTRYCKSCGANLEVLRQALTQTLPSGPLTMIGPKHVGLILMLSTLIGIAGFGIVFGCLVALSISIGPTLGGGLFPLLLLLGASGVFGVCFVVSSMMKMLKHAPGSARSMPQTPVVPAALDAPPASQVLPPYRQPVGSVVEHTTARLGQYAQPDREE